MAALENHVGSLPDDVYRFDRSLRAIRTADRKLVRGSDETTRLYHLDDDDPETSDRSAAEPDRVAELEARLDDWLSSFESAEATDDVSISDDAESRLERLGYLQ
jgi:hypothetical protein